MARQEYHLNDYVLGELEVTPHSFASRILQSAVRRKMQRNQAQLCASLNGFGTCLDLPLHNVTLSTQLLPGGDQGPILINNTVGLCNTHNEFWSETGHGLDPGDGTALLGSLGCLILAAKVTFNRPNYTFQELDFNGGGIEEV